VLQPAIHGTVRSIQGGRKRCTPTRRGAARFETDGIRGQDADSQTRQRGAESLEWISRQARYFTLANHPLAIVLMQRQNFSSWPLTRGMKKECLDLIPIFGGISNQAARVAVFGFPAHDANIRRRDRQRE